MERFRDYRAFAGRIASGTVRVGDRVQVFPGGATTTVTGIDAGPRELDAASAPQSVSLRQGARVLVKSGTSTVQALVSDIVGRRDLDTLALEPAAALEVNDIGQVRVRLASELPVEEYSSHRRAGAFLVIDPQSGYTLAAGIVTAPVEATADERAARV